MNMREIADLGDTATFLTQLMDTLSRDLNVTSVKKITPSDYPEVNDLVTSKYTTWEWNFGHTPQFTYTNDNGISSKIRKGHVTECTETKWIGRRFDNLLNDE